MNPNLNALHLKAKNLPASPGVYCMKNNKMQIIYVGKAKILPNRVKTYFNPKYPKNTKTLKMINEVKDFDFIVVKNEEEALRLEYNLIKQHSPKYNIKLKNTRGYPYLKIDLNNEFPKLEISYVKHKQKGVKFFGPYPNIKELYSNRDFLNQRLQLRTCSDHEIKNRVRPCLLFQLKQCSAPCVEKKHDYKEQISLLLNILEAKPSVVKELTAKMEDFATKENFEQAAKMRDLIEFVKKQKSTVNKLTTGQHLFLSWKEQNHSVLVGMLLVKDGNIVDLYKYNLENFEDLPTSELISQNLLFLLSGLDSSVDTFNLGFKINPLLTTIVQDEFKVKITAISNNEYTSLIQNNLHDEVGLSYDQLVSIKQELELENIPYKIECMDISNWQESHPVGSKVVMMEGILDKASYRKYKMKTKGPNDFAMIKELVLRRFAKEEDTFPDLLVIDGGIQQLQKAQEALDELKIQGVEVVGLAKDKVKSDFKSDQIIKTGERIVKISGQEIGITSQMVSYKITKLRDEAHRFAISYHRKLRSKNSLISGIED